jgi:hypothetical protein
MWAASYLREDAYKSFKSYLTHYLDKGNANLCKKPVKKVFSESMQSYFDLLSQSYKDLNEKRTAETRF